MGLKCKECGYENPPGAFSCGLCGFVFDPSRQLPYPWNEPEERERAYTAYREMREARIARRFVFFGLLALTAAFFFLILFFD